MGMAERESIMRSGGDEMQDQKMMVSGKNSMSSYTYKPRDSFM